MTETIEVRYVKNCIIYSLLMSILSLGVFYSMPSYSASENNTEIDVKALMREVRKARAFKKERVDITHIVERYIPVGTKKEVILEAFSDTKFGVHQLKDPQYYNPRDEILWDEGWAIIRKITPWYQYLFISHTDMEIYLSFNNGILEKVFGTIDTTYL